MRTELGRLEQFHFTRTAIGIDSCVICAADYSHTESQAPLTKDILHSALARLVQTHAALGVRAAEESPNRHTYVRLEHVDLDRVVTFVRDRALADIMQEQLSTEFDVIPSEAPLWRIIVLDMKTVIFLWHHGMGDGMTGVAFHKVLAKALNDPTVPSEQSTLIAVPSTLELAPTIESLIDVSPPLWTALLAVANLFIPTSWTAAATTWAGADVGVTPTPALDLRVVPFSAEELAKLLDACRAHNATITAALNGAAIAALSHVAPSEYKTLSSNIPLSMRDLAGVSSEEFCCHLSIHVTRPSINKEFSWDLAAEVSSELRKRKSASRASIGLLRFLFGNYAPFFTSQYGKRRGGTFVVSNLGVFDNAEGAQWRVDDIWFAACNTYPGAALSVTAVGVAGGGLNVVLTSGVGVLEAGVLDSVAARFSHIVRGLA